jgi:RecA-family ATPase
MSPLISTQNKLCMRLDEFILRPPLTWLIEQFLQKGSLALMFGEPGTGKTFYALDIACAVALGRDWRGKPTAQGSVAYVAAEDSIGVRNRLEVYCRVNQINPADLDLHVTANGANLLDGKWVDSYIQALKQISNLTLVVIDTLAASTPGGDENNSASMGMFIYLCKWIQIETGASVLVVHHCGKDISKGARGWSGLRGAADTVIFLRRLSDHYVADRTQKVRIGQQRFREGVLQLLGRETCR